MKSYHDIAEDGGSNVAGQVEAQRERMVRSLTGVRHRIAVGSGKGGVGKSTLSMLLATTLAGLGRRVAVFDADLNGPSQARLAGLGRAPFLPEGDGIALPRNRDGVGVLSLGSVLPEGRALGFDSVGVGDSHVWRSTREFTAMAELIGAVEWGEMDYLIYDLPPGTERTLQFAEFLGSRTAFVLVSTPADLARAVVSRTFAALEEAHNPVLGYVENMSGYYCEGCGEIKPLFPPGEPVRLDAPCLGRVPFDPRLMTEPAAATIEAIQEVADRIARRMEHER